MIDNIIVYLVYAFLLFGIGKYLYDQFKLKNYVKSIRNVVVGIVIVAFLYYAGNHGWLGNGEPCASYDTRGCNE